MADWAKTDPNSWQTKFVTKVGRTWRSINPKSYSQAAVDRQREREREPPKRLRKKAELPRYNTGSSSVTDNQSTTNELGEREYSIFSEATTLVDSTAAPRTYDHNDMMHRLAHHDSFDSLVDNPHHSHAGRNASPSGFDRVLSDEARIRAQKLSQKWVAILSTLDDRLWDRIIAHLDLAALAALTLTCKTLYAKFGPDALHRLNQPESLNARITFLYRLDRYLPDQLLCFPCARYHKRTKLGAESLRENYVANPLFECPRVKSSVLPRVRLSHRRELPYAFVQLALRHSRHAPSFGIDPTTLSRRWKCRDSNWTHRSRYIVHDERLLLRIVSSVCAPPARDLTVTGERHLLYDREEYVPFFSVCAHWRDGDLMKICKCALSHIPAPPDPYVKQLSRGLTVSKELARPNFLVRGCDFCRPARRCPECPTEYLVEVQMVEDASDKISPFKHALVVTRWSDLGDGSSPLTSAEWAAVNGKTGLSTAADGNDVAGIGAYESFSHIGRRAVGGIFESRVSGSVPGQRMLSLNPKNKKLGEDGHGWY